jgi:hypothetical protein
LTPPSEHQWHKNQIYFYGADSPAEFQGSGVRVLLLVQAERRHFHREQDHDGDRRGGWERAKGGLDRLFEGYGRNGLLIELTTSLRGDRPSSAGTEGQRLGGSFEQFGGGRSLRLQLGASGAIRAAIKGLKCFSAFA